MKKWIILIIVLAVIFALFQGWRKYSAQRSTTTGAMINNAPAPRAQ